MYVLKLIYVGLIKLCISEFNMAAQFKMDAIYEEKPDNILRFLNYKHDHVCFGAHIKQSFNQRPFLCYVIYRISF